MYVFDRIKIPESAMLLCHVSVVGLENRFPYMLSTKELGGMFGEVCTLST